MMRAVYLGALVLGAVLQASAQGSDDVVFDPLLESPTVMSHRLLPGSQALEVRFRPVETAGCHAFWLRVPVWVSPDSSTGEHVAPAVPDTGIVPWPWFEVTADSSGGDMVGRVSLPLGSTPDMIGVTACWLRDGTEFHSPIQWMPAHTEIPTSRNPRSWGWVKRDALR